MSVGADLRIYICQIWDQTGLPSCKNKANTGSPRRGALSHTVAGGLRQSQVDRPVVQPPWWGSITPPQSPQVSAGDPSPGLPGLRTFFETVLVTLDATHKVPRHPGLPREEHRSFPATLPLSPFYPPHLDRRVDSPVLSGTYKAASPSWKVCRV